MLLSLAGSTVECEMLALVEMFQNSLEWLKGTPQGSMVTQLQHIPPPLGCWPLHPVVARCYIPCFYEKVLGCPTLILNIVLKQKQRGDRGRKHLEEEMGGHQLPLQFSEQQASLPRSISTQTRTENKLSLVLTAQWWGRGQNATQGRGQFHEAALAADRKQSVTEVRVTSNWI